MARVSPSVLSTPTGDAAFADADAAALLKDHLHELARPGGNWELVKENASRRVYRGRVGGREVYVKHFLGKPLGRRLRALFGRDGARREFESSLLLRSHGVSALPVLALIDGPVRVLASAAVAPAVQGDAWHVQRRSAGHEGQRAIRQATFALADLVARMHRAGVSHQDLHCGNILVRSGPGDPGLVLMDLHRISRRRKLSRRRRAADLAQLMHDRLDLTTRTDRLRFLRRYLEVGEGEGTLRAWQEQVESLSRRHRRAQYAHLDRRVRGSNKYFSALRLGGGWRGHAILEAKHPPFPSIASQARLTPAQWEQALVDFGGLLAGPAEALKDSRSSRVIRRRLAVGPQELDVIIRQPKRRNFLQLLADCFRPSRVRRAFREGQALLSRRVPTAIPLAFLERRWGPFLLDSALITEAVDGQSLNRFLESVLAPESRGAVGDALPPEQRRRVAQEVFLQLGRVLHRLHESNFIHRDLKETSILVRWQGPRVPQVVLLGLNGLRRVRRITTRRRFYGLMRLNVSLIRCPVVNRAGRLRMLLGYLRQPGSGRINFKPYWRVLEDWSAKTIRQKIESQQREQKAVRRPPPGAKGA